MATIKEDVARLRRVQAMLEKRGFIQPGGAGGGQPSITVAGVKLLLAMNLAVRVLADVAAHNVLMDPRGPHPDSDHLDDADFLAELDQAGGR
jgi:hypothetical protein